MSAYQAQLPLMTRQIYYRLVASYGYDKTDKFSNRLGEVLNRARRVRLIPMSAIRDDGRSWDEPWEYSDGDHLRRTIYMRGILYRHAPTPKQAAWLRGLVEKLGGRFDG